MPIFDFICAGCHHHFEALVRSGAPAACPECGGTNLEKQMSLPSLKTELSHGLAMQAAKRRDQAQGKDRMHEQRKYEQSHND